MSAVKPEFALTAFRATKSAGVVSSGAQMLRSALPGAARGLSNFVNQRIAQPAMRAVTNLNWSSALRPPITRNAGAATGAALTDAAHTGGRQATRAAMRPRGGLDLMGRAAQRNTGQLPPLAKPPTNSFGHVAWNTFRGGLGFGAQENATGLARGAAAVAGTATLAAPLAVGMLGQGGQASNPYQQQLGMQVTASFEPAVYTVKTALNPEKVRAGVDLASYGALAAPLVTKLVAPKFYERHQHAMHVLDGAGLAGLTSTGVYGMATERGRKRIPDAMDVAGLGLMAASLHRRLNDH